jgi:hypothetical protein
VPRVNYLQTNFTAGELSPRLFARVDLSRYQNGCSELVNMVVQPHGGATRRTGSVFAGEVKDSSKTTILRRFEFSTVQAYVLEFGEGYIRFFRNHGRVELAGVPVEVATPYLTAELRGLRFAQSADILYIVHPNHAPRKLSRLSDTSWTLTTVDFTDGPWLEQNTTTTTIAPSARTGAITLTASASLFTSADVGRLVRVQHTAPAWSASAYSVGDRVVSTVSNVDRLYECVVAGTASAAPSSEGDDITDGTVRWKYLGRGKLAWGWARITAFTSGTVVSATVGAPFAATAAALAWQLGAWGGGRGYPRTVTFHQERTVWGGSIAQPQTLWLSQTGDFENMAPTDPDGAVLDTSAITITINDDQVNTIRWLSSFNRGMAVGTAGGEFLVAPGNPQEPLSPTNIRAQRQGSRGSSPVIAGERVDSVVLFVQRAGQKLRELVYDFGTDAYQTNNLTILSEHITTPEVIDGAYQEEPDGVVWLVRSDGVLLSLTYEREQEVRAWSRHVLGGAFGSGAAVVESVACIPNPDGTADEAWLVVKRTIGGVTRRYVEWLAAPFRPAVNGQASGFFVDCGLSYSGAPATFFTGLSHLEGQTVAIVADGALAPRVQVIGGTVSIPQPASVVHVGLPFTSRLSSLRLEAGAAGGTAQAQAKRVHEVFVRFHETLGAKVGRDDALDPVSFRTADDLLGAAPALWTGDKRVQFPAGWDRDGIVTVVQDEPLPMTVLGLIIGMQTNA